MYIVPFVSLAVLNLRIYCRIRQSTKERTKLTRNEQREIGMATMLLGKNPFGLSIFASWQGRRTRGRGQRRGPGFLSHPHHHFLRFTKWFTLTNYPKMQLKVAQKCTRPPWAPFRFTWLRRPCFLTQIPKWFLLFSHILGVVVVFFVCNVLALVVNILELMSIAITPLTQTSNLLVTLNSSVNFIIYIIYGEKFQRIFLQMFCHTQQKNQMIHRYTIATSNGITKSGVVEDSPSRINPNRLQTKLVQHGWKNSASVWF